MSLVKSLPLQAMEYHLKILATDGGGLTSQEPAEVTVGVITKDVPPPVFSPTMFNFSVKETVQIGTLVGQVEATLEDDVAGELLSC